MDYQNNFKQFLSRSSQGENENLTPKEKDELEEAINKSKETASFEEQQREIQKHFYGTIVKDKDEEPLKEKSVKSKQIFKKTKLNIDTSKVEKEFLSKNDLKFTFQDLMEVSGKSLDIIYHAPLFQLPIVTNPDYKKYSINKRTQILFNYYTKIDKLRARLARESIHKVPYPKPIMPSNKFKSSLIKNGLDELGDSDDFFDQPPTQELYVSRSGRQVKRKNYTEDVEGDSDPDYTSFSKKSKADDSDTKIILDTPFNPEENQSEEKSKALKTRKDTPRRPPALNVRKTPGSSRKDILLEKGLEQSEKKKQQQEEMENFEKSLTRLDESENEPFETSPVRENSDNSDANFIRKRVTPPIPNKKRGRGRKPKQDKDKSISPPGSPTLRRYGNINKNIERTKPKMKNKKSQENAHSQETPKLEKASCPICNQQFLQSEIVNHASNCGEDLFEERKKKIQCELCESEFDMNTDYEVHVKQCIASSVTHL